MKTSLIKSVLGAAALLMMVAGGCTTVRTITANEWMGGGMYLSYWEGQCAGMCTKGESRVKWCQLYKNNALQCENQKDAENALNPQK